jgi:2-polyprenyl-3-methyl-5-hydroxy-6-metoxy-1,4-benzoquinol methylase
MRNRSTAQPVIIKLDTQGVFQVAALDIGCGIGDNAIYIARHAFNVHLTAIDLVRPVFFSSLEINEFSLVQKLKNIISIFNLK